MAGLRPPCRWARPEPKRASTQHGPSPPPLPAPPLNPSCPPPGRTPPPQVVPGVPFFATKVQLGPEGVAQILGLGQLSDFEKEALDAALPELKTQIAKVRLSTCACVCAGACVCACVCVGGGGTLNRLWAPSSLVACMRARAPSRGAVIQSGLCTARVRSV